MSFAFLVEVVGLGRLWRIRHPMRCVLKLDAPVSLWHSLKDTNRLDVVGPVSRRILSHEEPAFVRRGRYVPPFPLVSVVVVRCVGHAGVSGWALEGV